MDQHNQKITREGNSDDATEGQRQEFLSMFHKSDTEFDLKNQLLEDLKQTKPSTKPKPFFDELFEKIWLKRKIELPETRNKNQFAYYLAQLAAILLIGLFIGYYSNSRTKTSTPLYYTSLAPKGSVSEMYLPDGTHIYLNSGSEIKYTIDGSERMREIFLNGEAWFQVAKNKDKPFLVHTSAYDVQVIGTIFNLKAYSNENEVVTTLEEGMVYVKSSGNIKLAEKIVLKPGEQLIFNKDLKNINITEVNTKWFTSWKDNKLVFVNMSFKDLQVLLERKYGVEIDVVDQNILNYHYDGIIKDETILEVLDILKQTLPIQYQIVGQKIVIQRKAEAERRNL